MEDNGSAEAQPPTAMHPTEAAPHHAGAFFVSLVTLLGVIGSPYSVPGLLACHMFDSAPRYATALVGNRLKPTQATQSTVLFLLQHCHGILAKTCQAIAPE